MLLYDLTNLASDHPSIDADFFVRAFAACCSGGAGSSHAVELLSRPTSSVGRPKRQLSQLTTPTALSALDVNKTKNTFGANVITEYAACCVAAALVSSLLKKRFAEVTVSGQRADYWLSDNVGAPAGACEVSGLVTKRLSARYQTKRRQILRNKTASPAYVSVTAFSNASKGYFCRVR